MVATWIGVPVRAAKAFVTARAPAVWALIIAESERPRMLSIERWATWKSGACEVLTTT